MEFGVCVPIEQDKVAKGYGWDFVELNVQNVFKGTSGDDEWTRPPASVLPTPAANSLVPGSLKIVGPDVDAAALRTYIDRVVHRAAFLDCRTLVFGSGAARSIPDGFDRKQARRQILDFLAMAAPLGDRYGITFVIEPLNRGETNVINGVAESLEYVRELNHPRVRQLVDTWHFWLESDPLSVIRDAGDLIEHVHVADKEGRLPPGETGKSDYRPIFRALKEIRYDARISVECAGWDWGQHGDRVLAFLKREWDAA